MRELYFRGDNFFGKLLRFFNLLEPERMVLSISKIFMWLMILLVPLAFILDPDNMVSLVSAVGGTIISTGNYAYRRRLERKRETEVDKLSPIEEGRE